jgi:hypothetical protein
LVHGFAHGFHGYFIGAMPIAEAHGARRSDGGIFDHTQKLQTQSSFHSGNLRERYLRPKAAESSIPGNTWLAPRFHFGTVSALSETGQH